MKLFRYLLFFLSLTLILSAYCGCNPPLEKDPAGPYRICSVQDLSVIGQYPDRAYILTSDLDLEGKAWNTIPVFSGSFDGNGHTISNFSILPSADNATELGFFGGITQRGQVKDLTLSQVHINAGETVAQNVGALAGVNNGHMENITLDRISIDASNAPFAQYIGTVAGYQNGSLRNILATGTIRDNRLILEDEPIYVGALVGGAGKTCLIQGGDSLSATDANGSVHDGLCAVVALHLPQSETVLWGMAGILLEGAQLHGEWISPS